MYKAYAGIGSRTCPADVCKTLTETASLLHEHNFILRSGGADGADSAFEGGAGDKKEIFLPWRNYNQNKSLLHEVDEYAFRVASENHPAWAHCDKSARKLLGRNVYQVLGKDLKSPSLFVVCWTDHEEGSGGTAFTIRLARANSVPVYNLFNTPIEEFQNIILP